MPSASIGTARSCRWNEEDHVGAFSRVLGISSAGEEMVADAGGAGPRIVGSHHRLQFEFCAGPVHVSIHVA